VSGDGELARVKRMSAHDAINSVGHQFKHGGVEGCLCSNIDNP